MNDQAKIAVDVRGAVKRYGDFTALKALSLSIEDNEFFTLLGPSGCGKTTLLRMIAGFESVTEGEIFLYESEIDTLAPNKRPINTVFQNYALFPHMTTLENVMFGLEMQGRSKSDAQRRAGEMLELVQLSQFSNRKPSQLSGGQQQRVALARALAPDPKVLLLDEPLSALDLKLRQAMRFELKEIQHETGITFIFVTHDQEEALTMSDRIAVMSAGELQQLGTAKDIYEHPNNKFVAEFIGETNLLEANVTEITGHGVICQLAQGHSITCEAVDGVTVGSTYHLSIRPERMILLDSADETNNFSENNVSRLSGVVQHNIYIGTDMQTVVDLAEGSRITVRTSNSERGRKRIFEPGTSVFIETEQGAARLLTH